MLKKPERTEIVCACVCAWGCGEGNANSSVLELDGPAPPFRLLGQVPGAPWEPPWAALSPSVQGQARSPVCCWSLVAPCPHRLRTKTHQVLTRFLPQGTLEPDVLAEPCLLAALAGCYFREVTGERERERGSGHVLQFRPSSPQSRSMTPLD